MHAIASGVQRGILSCTSHVRIMASDDSSRRIIPCRSRSSGTTANADRGTENPQRGIGGGKVLVARNLMPIALGQNRFRIVELPVTIDDQPRIAGQDCGRIKMRRQSPRDGGSTDVPGNVVL